MGKHTPGPLTVRIWKDGDPDPGNRILDADGVEIARLSYTGGDEDAMARGMAAWPDLADAVEKIRRKAAAYRELPVCAQDRPESWQRLDDLLKAIDETRDHLRKAGRMEE